MSDVKQKIQTILIFLKQKSVYVYFMYTLAVQSNKTKSNADSNSKVPQSLSYQVSLYIGGNLRLWYQHDHLLDLKASCHQKEIVVKKV